jgi:hypothetical protein
MLSEIVPSSLPSSYPNLAWVKALVSETPGSPGPTPGSAGPGSSPSAGAGETAGGAAGGTVGAATSVVDGVCSWYSHFLCSTLTKNKNISFSPIANGFVSRYFFPKKKYDNAAK